MRGHVAFDLCRTMLALCALYAFVVQGFAGEAQTASGSGLSFLCGHDRPDPGGSNPPGEGGLLIKPGESVELRPGGYHLMFMDLTGPAKEGDTQRARFCSSEPDPSR